jgi:hypothetical protein
MFKNGDLVRVKKGKHGSDYVAYFHCYVENYVKVINPHAFIDNVANNFVFDYASHNDIESLTPAEAMLWKLENE